MQRYVVRDSIDVINLPTFGGGLWRLPAAIEIGLTLVDVLVPDSFIKRGPHVVTQASACVATNSTFSAGIQCAL